MKKILIIQTAFLGDVILATPVVEQLHQDYPDSTIDILIRKGNEGLFIKHPFLHEIIIWNKKNKKIFNLLKIIKKIRSNKYDAIYNLQRFFSSGLITTFSGAQLTVGFDKNPLSFLFKKKIKHIISSGNQPIHEVDRNLSLVSDNNNKATIRLYPSEIDYLNTKHLKKIKYICIAPASVWFTKQYPALKWIEFIDQISNDFNVYLLGSSDDCKICLEIIKNSTNKNVKDLSGELSLLETTALMHDAQMNFCNDSAPLHLASSVNAPVTAVFCSTIPAFGFGPLSDNSKIIEINKPLDCRPCGLHGKKECPEKHFKCAMDIQTERLLKQLN